MGSRILFLCKYCGRDTFRTQQGLDQHLQFNQKCNHQAQDELAKYVSQQQQKIREFEKEDQPKAPGIQPTLATDKGQLPETQALPLNQEQTQALPLNQEQDEWNLWAVDDSDDDSDDDEPPDLLHIVPPDEHDVSTEGLERLVTFIRQNDIDYCPLSKDEIAAVQLLHVLRRKRATMDTYEAVMEWHYRASGEIEPHHRLGDAPGYITRDKIFAMLYKRYMINPAYNHDKTPRYYDVKSTILPVSKAKVDIVLHDARDIMVSLLTDPRFSDDDYLHHDPTNPLAPPPPNGFAYIADIDTSKSYYKTYEKLITDPTKQMLVPIFMYIDAAVTGQFDKNPVESLKMTHGLLTRKARDKSYAWRELGFMPNYHKAASRGKKMLQDTGHAAVAKLPISDGEGSVEEE